MKLSERTRVGTCIRRMYDAFGPTKDESGNRKAQFHHRWIEAVEGIKTSGASNRTRWLARKYLGIRCQKVAGRTCWMAPTNTLKVALEKAQRNSKSSIYQLKEDRKTRENRYAHDIVGLLMDTMKALNFDANPLDVYRALKDQGVGTRNVIIKARREAGINVVRFESQFHWIYPAAEVQAWLIVTLQPGPMEQDELFRLASERNYSSLLINQFRIGKGFKQCYLHSQCFWYDMNTWSPEKTVKEEEHG